ncbi:MAG TPA: indolepyruvate oxidoreductase subunit beta [Acidimicrobiia bacterium]|nr:indolepyruvate oxidoreductase subunit beta [Acidimicrobiia bacterium]
MNLVIAGVGGQGVLSIAAIITEAARREGLFVKQAEVHGMAQRGGSVQATIRLAPEPVASELVPLASAALVIGLEPVEALRQAPFLATDGVVVTAAEPFENLPEYPPLDEVHQAVTRVGGHLVEANRLAREAGSPRSANVVMVGAASPWLPIGESTIEDCIREGFAARGERMVEANRRAFRLGRDALSSARA